MAFHHRDNHLQVQRWGETVDGTGIVSKPNIKMREPWLNSFLIAAGDFRGHLARSKITTRSNNTSDRLLRTKLRIHIQIETLSQNQFTTCILIHLTVRHCLKDRITQTARTVNELSNAT